MAIFLYCDGLCEPVNDGIHGIATCGWVATDKDGVQIASGAHFLKEGEGATNNLAEYGGIIRALAWLWKEQLWEYPIQLHSDSQLAIRQLTGEYAVRSEKIRPFYEQAVRGLTPFSHITLKWIPGEENILADALTRHAYARHVIQHGDACFGVQYAARSRKRVELDAAIRECRKK